MRPIAHGGALYDLSSLMIVTPLYDASILSPRYYFGTMAAAATEAATCILPPP